MIFAYNPTNVGDVLMIITDDDRGMEQKFERKENVCKIQTEDGRVVGWNIFSASTLLDLSGNGQLELTEQQLQQLNDRIHRAGFEETVVMDDAPKFVVGWVKSCQAHKDSDHLSVTQVEVDQGETLQIVCGAPNIRAELKVVVAKPGAMMPDGMMIWPGELRGVASFGMICSARELHLPNAPQKRGILELPEDAVVGEKFYIGK